MSVDKTSNGAATPRYPVPDVSRLRMFITPLRPFDQVIAESSARGRR